jgi:hypothetical protein
LEPLGVVARPIPPSRSGLFNLASWSTDIFKVSDDGTVAVGRLGNELVDLRTGDSMLNGSAANALVVGNTINSTVIGTTLSILEAGYAKVPVSQWQNEFSGPWNIRGVRMGAVVSRDQWLVCADVWRYSEAGGSWRTNGHYAVLKLFRPSDPPTPGGAVVTLPLQDLQPLDGAIDQRGNPVFAWRIGLSPSVTVATFNGAKVAIAVRALPEKGTTIVHYSSATDTLLYTKDKTTVVTRAGKQLRRLRTPEALPKALIFFAGKVVWQYDDHFRIEGLRAPVKGWFASWSGNRKYALAVRSQDKTVWRLTAR